MTTNRQDPAQDYTWGKRKNKKWIIIVVAAAVVVAGVLGYVIFGLKINSNTNTNDETNADDGSALVRRAIDGVYVPADQANNLPVAVMIENLVSSRPPSGLSKANLVYEALAEGGITRFMAIYAGRLDASEIGPVRSARPYYLDWALEYGAMYAHVGGSPQAISDIKKYSVFDLNQFYNAQYFWRDTGRAAPHNLYTSGEKLAFALRDKKAASTGSYTPWGFKDEASAASRPVTDKSITIDFSSFNYKVEYKYSKEKNDYQRLVGGQPHVDKDGTAIRAKNVIVQKMKTRLVDVERLGMETIGEGEALIFQDGVTIQGRWEKKSRQERTSFFDASGALVKFNAGTTWIEVVPTDRDIVYN